VGYLITHQGWQWWPGFLIPFAFVGSLIAWRIWHEVPAATRRYIDNFARKLQPVPELEARCR
jgi:OPA family glycerol-3-phosphate transporter-like MFS transporter